MMGQIYNCNRYSSFGKKRKRRIDGFVLGSQQQKRWIVGDGVLSRVLIKAPESCRNPVIICGPHSSTLSAIQNELMAHHSTLPNTN